MRLVIIFLFFCGQVFADDMQGSFVNYQNKAKEMASVLQSSDAFRNFNADMYTNDSDAVHHPEQTKYYNNSATLKQASINEFNNSGQASQLRKTYQHEPSINGNSQTSQRLMMIIKNAETISTGQSNEDMECVEQEDTCETTYTEKTCKKDVSQDFQCSLAPDISFKGSDIPIVTWVSTCPNDIKRTCSLIKKQCVETGSTKNIQGRDVSLDCWKSNETYQCGEETVDTCSEFSNCSTKASQCLMTLGNLCIQKQLTMSCPTQSCTSSDKIVCGKPGFCTDGSCFDPSPTGGNTNSFADSVTKLAAAATAAQSVKNQEYTDENEAMKNITIEKGQSLSCGIGLGYNCCKGHSAAYHQCSPEEKSLRESKKKGLVIELGRYCSKNILGICIAHREGNCVFDSKLSRITQQQGKPQLGLNFGQAKSPNCSGFKVEEFQRLNFDIMDFSEINEDLMNGLNIPDQDEILASISERTD